MSTPQSIVPSTPRLRIGLGPVLTALGVLVAIATTIIILALNGANHSTVVSPGAATKAGRAYTPQIHYLGPRQEQAAVNPQSGGGTAPTTVTGNSAPPYTCLGAAQPCLR